MKWDLEYVCLSDIGRYRKNNQDNFICLGRYMHHNNRGTHEPLSGIVPVDEPRVLGIFDGMGGEDLGEMASFIASDTIAEYPFTGEPEDELPLWCRDANARICRYTDEHGVSSMGTTAAVLLFHPAAIWLCNIGDSRIFRYSGGKLKQISTDHVVQIVAGRKPALSQNLGIPETELVISPYVAHGKYIDGDVYLICSDGLTDMVKEEEIAQILGQNEVRTAGEILMRQALGYGGRDNTTIVVCKVVRHEKQRAGN